MADLDQFYSLREVQRMTGGKSRSTIYRWSRNGILPPTQENRAELDRLAPIGAGGFLQ